MANYTIYLAETRPLEGWLIRPFMHCCNFFMRLKFYMMSLVSNFPVELQARFFSLLTRGFL